LFRKQFPQYRTKEVNKAIKEGIACVKRKQRPDGSWYGSWGVCFTYAAWLATEALHLAGEPKHSDTFTRCCAFLLSKQREDGGWGEDFNSCVMGIWVENPEGSQVVNTAWAVMSLIVAGGFGDRHLDAIERGVRFLISKQLPNGDWEQTRITGVFNGNCAIHYPGFKNQMPVWALGKYTAMKEAR
jgi:lanosterol synthase